MNYNGILIIDKPKGWTSFDVVAKLRGTLKIKRIGHGGTLDPMATGVLPVFIGRATRAVEFCESADKEYIAGMRFGIVTDTQDITGKILSESNITVTIEELEALLPQFVGKQKQIPPMYSAVKINGKKLYELARQGVEIDRASRDIEVKTLELTENQESGTFFIHVVCTKGTYIRTLCHDIGSALGCGAALSYLRRTRAGAFTIDKAHTLDSVLQSIQDSSVNDILLPTDSIFSCYLHISLTDKNARKAKNGALRNISGVTDGKYRFYAPDGEFLLFGEVQNSRLKTIKNFFENYSTVQRRYPAHDTTNNTTITSKHKT